MAIINTPFTYSPATGSTSGAVIASATYYKFSGLTAESFSFFVGQSASGNNPALDGYQVVKVPGPGALTLLAYGGLGMMSRIRKRRQS